MSMLSSQVTTAPTTHCPHPQAIHVSRGWEVNADQDSGGLMAGCEMGWEPSGGSSGGVGSSGSSDSGGGSDSGGSGDRGGSKQRRRASRGGCPGDANPSRCVFQAGAGVPHLLYAGISHPLLCCSALCDALMQRSHPTTPTWHGPYARMHAPLDVTYSPLMRAAYPKSVPPWLSFPPKP